MENKIELIEADLECVTGGGSGSVPEGGITFSPFTSVEINHYYSAETNTNNVVYVFDGDFYTTHYQRENFVVDPTSGTWSSSFCGEDPHIVGKEFYEQYHFILNVQP